jgi:hypothetical protein
MSAAAEVDLDADVKGYLTRAFNNTCYGEPTWGTKLAIAFSIGGKTFHTALQIGRKMTKYPLPRWKGNKERGVPRIFFSTFVGKLEDPDIVQKPTTCIYFETDCVGAPALPVPTSQIHADDPDEKKCFDPPLTKDTIPEGYTQTDILQVFLTKLKLLQTRDVFLLDAAKIKNKYGNESTYLSVWRLLQGKQGVYEKYGYLSPIFTQLRLDELMAHRKVQHLALMGEGAIGHERAFDIVRRLVTTRKLKDFKTVDYYYDIMAKFEWHYKGVFPREGGIPVYEEMTIAELISKIPYENTWFEMRWGERSHINIFEALFIIVVGVSYESVGKLTLNAESAEWRKWGSELKFLSAEPFDERGAGAGGTRSRRTLRRRRSRRSKRNNKMN